MEVYINVSCPECSLALLRFTVAWEILQLYSLTKCVKICVLEYLFSIFSYLYFKCVSGLLACTCIYHVCVSWLWRPEKITISHLTRVLKVCATIWVFLELNPSSLQEQQVFLTTKSCFLSLFLNCKGIYSEGKRCVHKNLISFFPAMRRVVDIRPQIYPRIYLQCITTHKWMKKIFFSKRILLVI